MAISAGIFIKIILMVFFGRVEVVDRLHFDSYWGVIFIGEPMKLFVDNCPVFGVVIIDARSVLCATVIPLSIDRRRIDGQKIEFDKEIKIYLGWIIYHLHRFGGVSASRAHFAVRGIGYAAVGISCLGADHAVNLLHEMFRAPKASSGKIDCIHVCHNMLGRFSIFRCT